MVKIREVEVSKLHCIEVLLSTGENIEVDFSNRLKTIRFGKLEDESFFACVETDGEMIRWGHEIEMSLREIMDM